MLETLINLVTVLLALSMATERLVELIKGPIPQLNGPSPSSRNERWRQFGIHLISLFASIVVVYLCQDYIVSTLKMPTKELSNPQVLAFAILSSGGSSFWNSILTYLLSIKNLKRQDEVARQQTLDDPRAALRVNLPSAMPAL